MDRLGEENMSKLNSQNGNFYLSSNYVVDASNGIRKLYMVLKGTQS
jgi:hypothetical protein